MATEEDVNLRESGKALQTRTCQVARWNTSEDWPDLGEGGMTWVCKALRQGSDLVSEDGGDGKLGA